MSTENELTDQNQMEETETTNLQEENGSAESDNWKQKYDEMNDKYLRLYSEFDNYRRRISKERIELIGTASEDVLKSIIPVLDDMERAIQLNKTSSEIESIKQGFELVYTKLKSALAAKGLKEMTMTDLTFNPDLHEAITNIPAPSPELKGKIVDTLEKGYYLQDKIIRYAKVVVGE